MIRNSVMNVAVAIVAIILFLCVYPPTRAAATRVLPWVTAVGGVALALAMVGTPDEPPSTLGGKSEPGTIPAAAGGARRTSLSPGAFAPKTQSPFAADEGPADEDPADEGPADEGPAE